MTTARRSSSPRLASEYATAAGERRDPRERAHDDAGEGTTSEIAGVISKLLEHGLRLPGKDGGGD